MPEVPSCSNCKTRDQLVIEDFEPEQVEGRTTKHWGEGDLNMRPNLVAASVLYRCNRCGNRDRQEVPAAWTPGQ